MQTILCKLNRKHFSKFLSKTYKAKATNEAITIEKVNKNNEKEQKQFEEVLNRYHYLCAPRRQGAQIRYMVYQKEEWVGAISFGSPAWKCQARDKWIGWAKENREAKLQSIVNNTRFLINPHTTLPNAASQVLSMAIKKISNDWKQEYGRDVVLLETFVDEQYPGTCYKASNWIYVGETKGRGKWDSSHEKPLRVKKVFLYPLDKKFYEKLGGSQFKKPDYQDWVEEEYEYFESPDSRLKSRLLTICRDFFSNPTANIPQSCNSRSKTKGAYRFFGHKDITMETMLKSHYKATQNRLENHKVILAVQDTTSINYTGHNNPELGYINNPKEITRGIIMHDTMAFTDKGVPLGLLDLQTWERKEEDYGKSKSRGSSPIEDKESIKWLRSYQALVPIQQRLNKSKIVSVGDRESDIYNLFELARKTPEGPSLLVRACYNRRIAGDEKKLWETLSQTSISGNLTIEVPRKPGQKKRKASLAVSFQEVQIKKPDKKETVCLWAIYAREESHPAEVTPVSWMLLTTLPVKNFEESCEKISWYMIRWQIEIYHKIIKSGCRIENRQLETLKNIKACLGVDLTVAWRIFYLTKRSREKEDTCCTVNFEDYEWKALYCFVKKSTNLPSTPPTLREAVRMIASLGGFLGRKCDGEPGVITMWRGLSRLADISQQYLLLRPP